MNPEIANYFKHCFKLSFLASASSKFVSRAFWSVLFKVLPNAQKIFQPKNIKSLRSKLLSHVDARGYEPLKEVLSPQRLILAVGSFNIDDEKHWFEKFPDDEVTVSLHRWGWLLRGLTDAPAALNRDQGLNLMRSWIYNVLTHKTISRDAYSTGERIVNGSLFLLLTGKGEIPPDIASGFRLMGRQVAENLEYYRLEQTGNHAFNNARSLLFAGLVADLPGAVDLSYAISKERLAKLVTSEGFLREGSSHYHFLFTRWVLEMLWLAERYDNQTIVNLLKPYAKLLVKRCWFFLIQSNADRSWQIPLIGDVSPDFPPKWLLSLPWSLLACDLYCPDPLPLPPQQKGWSNLFGVVEGSVFSRPAQTVSFPNSNWFRIYREPWTVFVRAETNDGSLQANHKHHDLGSFVLFRDGALLLSDVGRLDYTSSAMGRYGQSALAHNTLLIDGLGVTVDGPSWLSERYLAVQSEVDVQQEDDSTIVTIKHNGFARLADNSLVHQRRLKLSSRGFRVEDRLNGKGNHRVQMRFHFAPGIQLHFNSSHDLKVGDCGLNFSPSSLLKLLVQNGDVGLPPSGLFFPAYGKQVVSCSLDMSAALNFPVVLINALNLEG